MVGRILDGITVLDVGSFIAGPSLKRGRPIEMGAGRHRRRTPLIELGGGR